MDKNYSKNDLRAIGAKIRAIYKKRKLTRVRVKLHIDSAGGHGMARGQAVFEELKKMMDKDFSTMS